MSSLHSPGNLPAQPPSPLEVPSAGGAVRRHHTITAATSRSVRVASRELQPSEDDQALEQDYWNEDEPVDQDWVGGVGAVGEKSLLHRQSSLPTKYHRAFQSKGTRHSGALTPKSINSLNSLSAITGHEDDEDWEREMRGLRNEGEHKMATAENAQHQQVMETLGQSNNPSPLSPHFSPPHAPSPPPGATIRRHTSLTHGAAGHRHQTDAGGLKRAGTLQASSKQAKERIPPSPPPSHEEEYIADDSPEYPYDEEYFARVPPQPQPQPQPQQQQLQTGQTHYGGSPMGRGSPWGTPNTTEWRPAGGSGFSTSTSHQHNNFAIDDVTRALSNIEMNQVSQLFHQHHLSAPNNGGGVYAGGPGAPPPHPPRFSPNNLARPLPAAPLSGSRTPNGGVATSGVNNKHQLDIDGPRKPQSGHMITTSGSYLPSGAAHPYRPSGDERSQHRVSTSAGGGSSSSSSWDQKDRPLSSRASGGNLNYVYNNQQQQQGKATAGSGGIPSVPAIPSQYLSTPPPPPPPSQQQQQQQQSQAGAGAPRLSVPNAYAQTTTAGGMQGQNTGFIDTPIDVPSLIATKGYNPPNFDIRPPFARYFVIKSYTEDDVHKSLKYEIWSSTDPGNKRLDKAFKECAGRGPIYLFFSVNASGHFCGMAEMLTPVDYTRSSTVWASDKWKGVFKVRWVFVRDIPNANLRHIRLINTQERKPVTNSRDTQELLPDAGQEMLRIFHTHPARTSLLQDFAFYELQAMQKMQNQQQGTAPGSGAGSPPNSAGNLHSPQSQAALPLSTAASQGSYALASPYGTLAPPPPQMAPMMQMGMGMNSHHHPHHPHPQYAVMPQTQAMHQSVLRHHSPAPGSNHNSGYVPPGTAF